jgi:predicted transcriptional regulator
MASPPIKLPEPLDSQLTAIAKQRRMPRAKVLREALSAYAEPDTKPKGQTASELAADLMFDGPGDLSTNAKYMAGYGRDARHR